MWIDTRNLLRQEGSTGERILQSFLQLVLGKIDDYAKDGGSEVV